MKERDALAGKSFVVGLVIAVCNGCGSERNFPIAPPFRSAQEFIDWEKRKPIPPCVCGSPTADLKLRLDDPN